MKYLLILVFACACSVGSLFAQDSIALERDPQTGAVRCASTYHEAWLRARYPNMPTQVEFERWLRQVQATTVEPRDPIVTLPVIVHIIHDGNQSVGQGANLAPNQVVTQLDVLNEDFRRILGTPGYNTDSVGADSEIEFCLALIDPDSNVLAEPGIVRYTYASLNLGSPPYSTNTINSRVKPATQFDPTRYLNIWVIPVDNDILGYAQFPSSSGLSGMPFSGGLATTDGVVVTSSAFGRGGSAQPPYNGGRTLTHEVGHYLGLRHTWGDGDCTADDFCGDTPNAEEPNYGCLRNRVSCGSPDMVNNYMDYSNDACMDIFTLCQKQRMRTVLLNSPRRRELINSTVCTIPIITPVARFDVLDSIACYGVLRFADRSRNRPESWFWQFGDGDTSSQAEPVHTFDSSGVYAVQLVVSNGAGSDTIIRQVNVDFRTAGTVDAGPDTAVCNEGQAVFVQLAAVASDPQATISWSPARSLSSSSVPNPLFFGNESRTYVITATTPVGCTTTDTFTVEILPPFVAEVPDDSLLLDLDSIAFVTTRVIAPDAVSVRWEPNRGFVAPTTATDSLVQLAPDSTTLYRVTATDAQGCESTDSVWVRVSPRSNPDSREATLAGLALFPPFPNPTTGYITLQADFPYSGQLSISLVDLRGRRIKSIYEEITGSRAFRLEANLGEVAAGSYFLVWQFDGRRWAQRLVIQ